MTNEEFIAINREQDIRPLALKKMPEGVNAIWCLQQIEGYQIAKRKLPHWAGTEGLWYPPRLSMEQCSSEETAIYKQETARRLCGSPLASSYESTFADITGGFGVDFSYMAREFGTAFYVERQQELCNVASHNLPLLGLSQAQVVNADSLSFLNSLDESAQIIYADPARRSVSGRKTVAIEDCTPDISVLQHLILSKAAYAIIKLSPMLDITQALRTLRNVSEIHIVSVKGECKELLFVLRAKQPDTAQAASPTRPENEAPIFHCVNLATGQKALIAASKPLSPDIIPAEALAGGMYLLEPNASILKANMQDAFAKAYGLRKLHPQSNLFVCDTRPPSDIPARTFRIAALGDFSKNSIKNIQNGARQGNLTIRNFPSTVAELRKRLKLKEGGKDYFFATTLSDGRHTLLRCLALSCSEEE